MRHSHEGALSTTPATHTVGYSPGKDRHLAISLLRFENREEGFLRNLNLAYLFHTFLAGRLFRPQFPLPRDVAAVALRGDILADRGDGFSGDDPAADGRLDGDFKQMTVDLSPQFLDQLAATTLGHGAMDDGRESIDALAGHEDIESHEVRRPIA